MRRAVVIGGTGFLGRQIVAALAERRWEITTIARTATRSPSVRLNLAREDLPVDLIENVGLVVLAAGNRATPDCGLAILRRLATSSVLRRTPFILFSSAAVYPSSERPAREDDAIAPATNHGRMKLAEETLARDFFDRLIILRAFNPIGPGMRPGLLLSDVMTRLRALPRGGVLHTGPLDPVRDFLPARAVGDAAALVAEEPVSPGAIYNVASGSGRPCRQLVGLLLDEADRGDVTIEEAPGETGLSISIGDPTALRERGWNPDLDLETAVHAAWIAAE